MADNGDIRQPLKTYIGGPWALLFMALASLAGVIVLLATRSRRRANAPAPVSDLDLDRYSGTWFEIARIPTPQNRDLVGNSAHYELREDGRMKVRNHAWVGTLDGPEKTFKGIAWAPNPDQPGKLKVRFGLNPLTADYWVVELDEDYTTAVVVGPDRMRMRVFSRQPQMTEESYGAILQRLGEREIDTSLLVRTLQPEM